MVMVKVYLFVFQSVKISFHWSIVIWIACLVHALCDAVFLTEFRKSLRCILTFLITMQDNTSVYRTLTVRSFLQGSNGKNTCYMTIYYAGSYTSIVEIYNSAIISDITSGKKQVCQVSSPLFVDSRRFKVLIYKIVKLLMYLFVFISWLLTPDYRSEA